MSELLLIRQTWHELRRDLDRHRSNRGSSNWSIENDALVTRLNDLRVRLSRYLSPTNPQAVEELRCARGLMPVETVIRRTLDRLPES